MTPPLLLAARAGFQAPGAESFYGRPIWSIHLFGVDLSINRTVVLMFAATILVALVFTLAFAKPKLIPRGVQNTMELGVDFVRGQIVLPAMGPRGLAYLPYLTTLFFFIFFCNVFEIIPFLNFPPLSRFGIPLVLAVFSYVLFLHAGIKEHGAGHYLKNALIPAGVPVVFLFFLVPIEFVTTFLLRPFTLAVRLMANMVAGHLLLTVFFLGTAYLYGRGLTFGFGALSMVISVVLVGFELFVAALQAFIFTILTAVYIAGSYESAH